MTIDYNARAYRLLEAIHDLASGDPQTAVLSARVSARIGIPNTYRAFTTPSRYLKELGLLIKEAPRMRRVESPLR